MRHDAPSHGTIQISVLNLVTASISPSVLAVRELHALSPRVDTPLARLTSALINIRGGHLILLVIE